MTIHLVAAILIGSMTNHPLTDGAGTVFLDQCSTEGAEIEYVIQEGRIESFNLFSAISYAVHEYKLSRSGKNKFALEVEHRAHDGSTMRYNTDVALRDNGFASASMIAISLGDFIKEDTAILAEYYTAFMEIIATGNIPDRIQCDKGKIIFQQN